MRQKSIARRANTCSTPCAWIGGFTNVVLTVPYAKLAYCCRKMGSGAPSRYLDLAKIPFRDGQVLVCTNPLENGRIQSFLQLSRDIYGAKARQWKVKPMTVVAIIVPVASLLQLRLRPSWVAA